VNKSYCVTLTRHTSAANDEL